MFSAGARVYKNCTFKVARARLLRDSKLRDKVVKSKKSTAQEEHSVRRAA